MPFCTQCGADNPESSRFCDQCGAALIPVTPQATQVSAAPTGAAIPAISIGQAAPVSGPTVAAGPSVCPQCGTAVIPGEAFCDTCGAPLMAPSSAAAGVAPPLPYSTSVPQQPSYPPPQQVAPLPATPAPQPVAAPQPDPRRLTPVTPMRASLAPGQLVVQSSGMTLQLPGLTQAFVGRADTASNFFPEIDLTDVGALEGGVGRRHVRLFVQGGQVYAEDLDSTNGTFLNGQKLQPHQSQVVSSGDELRLGRLALRVQF